MSVNVRRSGIRRLASTCAALGVLLGIVSAHGAPATDDVAWVNSVWVNHLLWRAERLSNDLIAAEAACRQALGVAPSNGRVIRRLVDIYARGGHAAMTAMSSWYGWNLLGVQDLRTVFTSLWLQVESGAVAPGTDDVLQVQREEFRETITAAREKVRQRNLVEAELLLRGLLDQYPRNLPVLLHLGNIYVLAREWAMATMSFGYAARLYPENPDIANNLALALEQIGQMERALQVLRQALERYPDTDYLLINCARIADPRDPATARQCYRRLLEFWPDKREYRLRYARLLAREGELQEAHRQYAAVLQQNPDNEDALLGLASIAVREGDREEARLWLDRLSTVVAADQWKEIISRPEFQGIYPAERTRTQDEQQP